MLGSKRTFALSKAQLLIQISCLGKNPLTSSSKKNKRSFSCVFFQIFIAFCCDAALDPLQTQKKSTVSILAGPAKSRISNQNVDHSTYKWLQRLITQPIILSELLIWQGPIVKLCVRFIAHLLLQKPSFWQQAVHNLFPDTHEFTRGLRWLDVQRCLDMSDDSDIRIDLVWSMYQDIITLHWWFLA